MNSKISADSILFLFALIVSSVSRAQTDFANCNKSSKDVSTLKQPLSDDQRARFLEDTLNDLFKLESEFKSPNPALPKNLLKQCFLKRKEVFETATQFATEGLKSSPQFLKPLAFYSRLNNRHEDAYKYFQKTSELLPKDTDLKFEAFQSWITWKTEILQSKDPNQITESEIKNIVKTSEELLEPIIRSRDVSNEIKIAALKNKIKISESFLGRTGSAISDWKKIVDLDSKDLEALSIVAEYEFERKNYSEAKKYYILLNSNASPNLNSKRNLMEIFYIQKDHELAREWGKKLLDQSNQDPVVMAYTSWAFLQSSNFEQAQKLSAKALAKDKSLGIAKETLSGVYLAKSIEMQKKGMIAKQMLYLDKAFKVDSSNLDISKKLALGIFDTVKNQTKLSSKARKKDFAKVSTLLSLVIKNNPTDETSTLILIDASRKSNSYSTAKFACDSYLSNIGFFQTSDALFQCIDTYKVTKNEKKQKEIIEKALTLPQFESSKGRLNEEILKLSF